MLLVQTGEWGTDNLPVVSPNRTHMQHVPGSLTTGHIRPVVLTTGCGADFIPRQISVPSYPISFPKSW